MRIERLRVKNFRCFENLEIQLHPKCNVLVGINGAGKSTILDALAIALGGYLTGFDGIRSNSILPEDAHYKMFCVGSRIEPQEQFPVEINKADYQMLLRVPGIGVKSAQRICKARKSGALNFENLKKIGVVLKRALYFITCNGKMMYHTKVEEDYITRNLLAQHEKLPFDKDGMTYKQLSLFDDAQDNVGLFGI